MNLASLFGGPQGPQPAATGQKNPLLGGPATSPLDQKNTQGSPLVMSAAPASAQAPAAPIAGQWTPGPGLPGGGGKSGGMDTEQAMKFISALFGG